MPNAGKSTLLSRLSRALPEISDYPFTTKRPNLGIVSVGGERAFVLADLPGLIEGASQGVGLGHEFLRHVERTRVLLHLVEPLPTDGADPLQNYRTIRRELELYRPELAAKPEVVAVSKSELTGATGVRERMEKELGREVLSISAVTGEGLSQLVRAVVERLAEEPSAAPEPPPPVRSPHLRDDQLGRRTPRPPIRTMTERRRQRVRPVDQIHMIAIPNVACFAPPGRCDGDKTVIRSFQAADNAGRQLPFRRQPIGLKLPGHGEIAHAWCIRRLGVKYFAARRGEVFESLIGKAEELENRANQAAESLHAPIGEGRTAVRRTERGQRQPRGAMPRREIMCRQSRPPMLWPIR